MIYSEGGRKAGKDSGLHGGKSCCQETQNKHLSHDKKGMLAEHSVRGSPADALIKLASFTVDCRSQAGLTRMDLDITVGTWKPD